MHGAALIDGILAEALRVSRERGNARVTRLEVELSPTGHVTQDEVRTRLAALSRGTSADGADIRIKTTARRFRCFSCGEVFTSFEAGPSAECLDCHGVAMSIDEARDCVLAAVEVADPASGAD
jgi:Zn finger protein HypA/HybF involved in hydrogenase expression